MAVSKQTIAWDRIRLLLSELVDEHGDQRKVQKLTGLDSSFISRALDKQSSRRDPQVSTVEQLLRALKMRSSYFFEEPTPKSYREYVRGAGPDPMIAREAPAQQYMPANVEALFSEALIGLIEHSDEPPTPDEMRALRRDAMGLITDNADESRMRLATYLRGIKSALKSRSARR